MPADLCSGLILMPGLLESTHHRVKPFSDLSVADRAPTPAYMGTLRTGNKGFLSVDVNLAVFTREVVVALLLSEPAPGSVNARARRDHPFPGCSLPFYVAALQNETAHTVNTLTVGNQKCRSTDFDTSISASIWVT